MPKAYLFFADGDLRVFISELVARQCCQDGDHHFFTFNPGIQETWNLYPWTSRTLLDWVHKNGDSFVKKYCGMRRRIHAIQQSVGDKCEGADEIVLHSFQIYSERINYLIHYLQNRFPLAKINARLIPDGSLNLMRRPMHGVRKLPQVINRIRWAFDPQINYYRYAGDRLGADADIVDRIYLPKGFPHEYDPARIHWLELPQARDQTKHASEKTALVVGTALTQTGVCSRNDMQLVAARIERWLREKGIEKAWYKPHHKEPDDQFELWSPGCEVLQTKKGIERILLENQYDCLIGMCSTALLNAKLMFQDLSVTSCGIDLLEKRLKKGSSAHRYGAVCEKLGIDLVPVLESRRTLPCPSKAA